ncbi:MAG TPA: FecR domain-containing protein [Burkholderiales bacterium]|nr:FecR domain-containing protein [Burkholderiales bacterium]
MKLHSVGTSLIAVGLLLAAVAQAQTPSVGRATRLTGDQISGAQAPGAPARKLSQGDPVFAGERIRTGTRTVLEIEFNDKSRFTLGPNTEFEVEKYFQAAGGSSGEEAFTSRVFKGAFRFVSGLIARRKHENVHITIAVATIGIRGTHFEGEVTERQEKDGKTVDASAKVALLEPEGSDGNAIVVENKFGSVVIDKPGYGTEIPDEKSPPSPVKRMQLRTIENLQRALRPPAGMGGPARRF